MTWGGRTIALRRETGADGRITSRYPVRPSGLGAMLAAAAASARGDGEALVFGDRRWTWADLAEQVARLAGGLTRAGVARGDRVALLLENDPAFVLIAFAVLRLGAILVPISAREEQAGIAHMLDDSGASLLLSQRSLVSRLEIERCASLRACICIDDEAYRTLFDAAPVPSSAEDEEDVAVILYTSGTTGPAKGVTLRHGAIVHSALTYVVTMGLGPGDRSVAAVPFSHVTGFVALIATMAQAGGTLIVMRGFSAGVFLETAERERMTHSVMVPAMYNLCVLNGGFAGRDLSAWRIAGFGGAPMPLPTIRRLRESLPDLQLMNLYGATETTSPAVIMPPELAESRADAVGEPVPGCDIIVMDEAGREVPRGTTGELWIGGPMVSRGYWARAEGDAFCGGYWRSGDLGSIDEAGIVTLHGRSKDVINRGGYKIFPAELESALTALPDVIEVAVVARRCAVLGERVHACIVVAEGSPADAVIERCVAITAGFSDYKRPETWDVRHEPLPRNANGKILKRVIAQALPPYAHSDLPA